MGRAGPLLVLPLVLAACAASGLPPLVDSRPEAPTAKLFRSLSPPLRELVLPPAALFEPRAWVERIVCGGGELPGWKRTKKERHVESYDVECPGEPVLPLVLDASRPPPPAAAPLRLLAERSFPHYATALKHLEKKEHAQALRALDLAQVEAPDEPVYRRDRVYLLYLLGRTSEALLEADELLRTHRSALLYKYRALAARDLGRTPEVLRSLEGMLSSATPLHPLYAEAVCAKGLILTNGGEAEGERLVRRGCELDYAPCCEALEAQRRQEATTRRALEAARALPVQLPTRPPPESAALQSLPPEEPGPGESSSELQSAP